MKKLVAPSEFELLVEPPSIKVSPVKYSLSKNDFMPAPIPVGRQKIGRIPLAPYLIIGFDTEFQTSGQNYTRNEIVDGKAKNEILSYQFHAIYSEDKSSFWQGISCPRHNERISLGEFISFAIAEGVRQRRIDKCPLRIYLVGHFTRADIPAFSDFQNMTDYMSSIRNTFSTTDSYLPIEISFPENDGSSEISLAVTLRDTMLLTPATSKSLSSIGDLLGKPKIILDADPIKEQFYKENMSQLRRENWELFKQYALTDAEICAAYAQAIIDENEGLTGITKMPATLTSIGVDLLWKHWEQDSETEPLRVLGKESVPEKVFDKKRGYYIKQNRETYKELVHLHVPLATECYHGGRNEQFWFGPGYVAEWHDYDLASAYPTAMSLIGLPDWDNPIVTNDPKMYQADTFGFVSAKFTFPDSVRYPSIPVRTDNGLIFPRSGSAFFCAPELALARSLGAQITIKHGVIFPTKEHIHPFGDFVKDCIQKRKAQTKGSLKELFWKEITNSTYGKTAQGLMEKRVFDMRERGMRILPPSRITNPFYAALITSMVRAVLGEIMNNIPDSRMVFSCTTDGFLTDASESDILAAQGGELCRLFSKIRAKISGAPKILEEKHKVIQPLGWRTRGQATLKAFIAPDERKSSNIVLAKGGIRAPRSHDTDDLQNQFITNLFFERKTDTKITIEYFSSVRDMVFFDADLVGKSIEKRLNMEFDWKRRPKNIGFSREHSHVAFSTTPWESVSEFQQIRDFWQEFTQKNPICVKTPDDYQLFSQYVLALASLAPHEKKYLRKSSGAIRRLRQSLTRARRHNCAGLSKTDTDLQFADLLKSCGIPCSVKDVENARPKNPFIPSNVPATPEVVECLNSLKKHIGSLVIEEFLPLQSREPLLPPYDPSKFDSDDDFLKRLN